MTFETKTPAVALLGTALWLWLGAVSPASAQTRVTTADASTTAAADTLAAVAGELEPELVTDRPDFTESSEVVGRGRYQFESGFSLESEGTGAARARAVTLPGALLRVGLGPKAELRLGTDGFLSERVGALRVSGYGDFEVGAKIRLFNEADLGVDLAVIPMVSLPTGSDTMSSGTADPTVKLTWARSLPRNFGLTGNVNVASLSDDRGRFTQGAFSFSLGHELFAGWGGYLETYGFTPMERDASTGTTIDGGITRGVGGNLQFDIEFGRGVTGPAPDWFVGFGFAVRGQMPRSAR